MLSPSVLWPFPSAVSGSLHTRAEWGLHRATIQKLFALLKVGTGTCHFPQKS